MVCHKHTIFHSSRTGRSTVEELIELFGTSLASNGTGPIQNDRTKSDLEQHHIVGPTPKAKQHPESFPRLLARRSSLEPLMRPVSEA